MSASQHSQKNQADNPRKIIISYCMTAEQNKIIESFFPANGYELIDTDAPTDIIAIGATALIINASALDSDSVGMLFDFYTEVGVSCDETVFWIGNPTPPISLRKVIHYYSSFDELAPSLKYQLLTAHSRVKKAADFSRRLTYGIKILSLIRSRPGIRTQELAQELELESRTVQRYIAALQATGEWIQYNAAKRGWELFDGVSILFGDI